MKTDEVAGDDHYLNYSYCYVALNHFQYLHHHLSSYNQWTVDDYLAVADDGVVDDGAVEVVPHDGRSDGDFVEVLNICHYIQKAVSPHFYGALDHLISNHSLSFYVVAVVHPTSEIVSKIVTNL